jgi:hypothetical protein
LFIIWLFSLSIIVVGYPLCFAIWNIVFISWFLCSCDNVRCYNLFNMYLYGDILCFRGWLNL